ncbi:beta-ketoacyl synthase N-terminal-like domain-containing protein [Streptomyces sp. AP-93]|uniref:beta-ketoacyl synthase N-terminal-like domain-containing protein n=1 Tax=Streptomyces sp. AP-93 TaxID=2929048 RepID=UPI001FB043E3|nr:beta-ketoacyl synthase N-terminal-like domain-containing protein [Streptomyces sp. AP-93]MCJ0871748.1 3-oxoacyl-ACP synthase [Streptomyces sp. AP-93]
MSTALRSPPAPVRTTDLAVTGIGVVVPEDAAGAGVGAGAGDGTAGWFDHRTRLGPRGFKYLPSGAQYLLASVRAAVADRGGPDPAPPARRGLVLATNGGLADLFDSMDRTVAETGADGLGPALAPYFAVNVLGSRPAAEQDLKGFALTVGSPRTAALEAVQAGARALAAGRADTLVVGACEQAPRGPGGGAEQGSVALVLERPAAARSRGARVHGVCRTASLFAPPRALAEPDGRRRLAALTRRTLAGLLEAGAPVPRVHYVLDGSAAAAAVAEAVSEALGEGTPPAPGSVSPAGAGCLGPALHLARMLTGAAPDRLLVTATCEGHVAFALVDKEIPPC